MAFWIWAIDAFLFSRSPTKSPAACIAFSGLPLARAKFAICFKADCDAPVNSECFDAAWKAEVRALVPSTASFASLSRFDKAALAWFIDGPNCFCDVYWNDAIAAVCSLIAAANNPAPATAVAKAPANPAMANW